MPDFLYTSPRTNRSYRLVPDDPSYSPTELEKQEYAAYIEQQETASEQPAAPQAAAPQPPAQEQPESEQSIGTARLNSAIQGITTIPGTIAQGVGATFLSPFGITALEESGKYAIEKAKELTPIAPKYQGDLSVELFGAGGQALGQLATLLGAGPAPIATKVALGMSAAMGASSGVESANRRGLTGINKYNEILGYGATEVLTERMFGFGSMSFFKPAKGLQEKVFKAGTTIGGEMVEEGAAGLGTNVVSNLTAVGLDIPSPELFSGEALMSYGRQSLAGGVGGTVFAGAQLAMGKQATQESITRKSAVIDGVFTNVTGIPDEVLTKMGAQDIQLQTFTSPIDAAAIDEAPSGAKRILEGIYGNELEVPIGKPTPEQEQNFDDLIAADAAKKAAAAAAAGVPTPAATEAAVLPTEEPAPAEGTVPPPVAGAPIVPPTTPPPDATTEGIIPENGFQERVQTNEGGAPPEAGSGDRSFTSGQGQIPVVQEQAVTPPLPSEIRAGVQMGVASVDPDMRDLFAGILEYTLAKKGTLTWKDIPKELSDAYDTISFGALKNALATNPQEAISLIRGDQNKTSTQPLPSGATPTEPGTLPTTPMTGVSGGVAAAPATIGVADLATGPLTRVTARKNVDPKRVVSGNKPKGIPPKAVETPEGNVEFVTPEMAPGILQPARRKPLNDAVVKETVRKVFGTIPSNLSFINIDRQVDGMASAKNQTIQINLRYIPNAKRLEEILRHEAVHLIYQDPLVQADLELLRQEIPADLAKEVDRLYSDPEFTDSIRKEEAVVRLVERLSEKTAWKRFVGSVRAAFQRLFGRPPAPRELTLAANRILERAVANVAVQRTDAQPDSMGDASDVRLAFAGEQSIKNLSGERRKFMADSLDAAKAMAAAGKSSEEIRAVTGWFPGTYDGKLRYEIPDSKASFASTDVYNEKTTQAYGGQAFNRITVSSMIDRVKSGKVVKLSEVFQHDELFAAYPEAANISFFPIAGNVAQGSHRVIDGKDVITATITIAADGSISAASTSTILHELQHFIQQREGFAVGGSPDNLVTASDLTDAAKFGDGMRGIQKYEAEIAGLVRVLEEERAKKSFMGFGGPNQKTIKALEDSIARVQESVNSIWAYQKKNLNIDKDSTRASLLSAINRVDSKLGSAWVLTKRNEGLEMLYRLLSGEIEARDVQARQNLTPEQRKATAPYSSENIAKEDAIVMFGSGGPQASMSMPSPKFSYTPAPTTDRDTKAYHFGDGGVGADTTLNRMSGGRSTGHFGTGTYFLGDKGKANARADRPVLNIDLNGKKLARPSDPLNLHEGLRIINREIIRGNTLGFENYSDEGRKALFKINVELGLSKHTEQEVRAAIQKVELMFKENRNDGFRTPSTYVMQELGYDGIDVRGTEADNGDYGSVLYPQKVSSDIRYSMTPQAVRHSELEDKFNAGTITPEETTEAERITDAAAKAAGFDAKVWHFSKSENKFDVFNLSKAAHIGHHFGGKDQSESIKRNYQRFDWTAGKGSLNQFYLSTKGKSLRVKDGGNNAIKSVSTYNYGTGSSYYNEGWGMNVANALKEAGYTRQSNKIVKLVSAARNRGGDETRDEELLSTEIRQILLDLGFKTVVYRNQAEGTPSASSYTEYTATEGVKREFSLTGKMPEGYTLKQNPSGGWTAVDPEGNLLFQGQETSTPEETTRMTELYDAEKRGVLLMSDSVIILSPEQIKSADTFTGVPLDQRFNPASSDIRYSMTPVDDTDVLGYTTQVFGEKTSVAEVESIKEIYASIRKTLFDYTQPVTDASLQEFYLLYNSIRPTESGKADILWLKDFGTQTAYPGAVLGALFAFSDKIPDGGQAQREIIELIERSRLFPEQSFSDFWTGDSSTGTVTEGGRALNARSYIVNYLNKLRGVLSHRALRIEAAAKKTNLPAADIKAIDVSTNGQADEGEVVKRLDEVKTPNGTPVIDAVAGAARPEGENDPRNKPENSPATDPKTSSELAAKRLISKYNTKKTKKIEKKEADVVTVLFKEHLSLKGGQSSADLKQKLIDAGLSPATATELTATAENELNRSLQAERNRDSEPMEGADALSPSDKSAKAIVSKLAVSQSDTWSWPDPANKDPVVALVARYYKANGNMTNEQLDRELEKLKVEEGLRAVLINAVSAELSKKKSVAQAKEADIEKDALAIINKLSQTQSDTLSWPIEKPTPPIVELVTRFYDANGSMSAQALDAELIKLGLPTRSRIILVNSVSAELSKRQAVKAAREKLIAENKPTKSAESFAANWQKSQDAPKDAKDTEQDQVRSYLNQITKVGRGEFHFDLSPDGKALFFDIVYKKLLGLNVSEKAAMAATSAAYQKYLTNRANQIAALRTMVAEKGLARALAREMMNITATNQRDPEFAKKFIKQVLLDAGIPEDIADASLPLLLPSFQKALADTREQLLRDFIDGRPKGAKRIPKPVVDEFLKAVRLGATNPDYEPSTPFAKANKWRNFTRAEHDEMARLDEIAMDPMQTRQEQQIALAGIAKIVSSKITEYDKLVVAAEIYRNSALSNFLTTGGIQVWTPVFSSAARVLTDGVVGLVKEGNFNRFIASVESFMRAASPAALKSELFSAFGQNITTFNKAYEIDNQAKLNELSNLYRILDNSIKTWKTTKNPVAKAKALIGITYGSMDYVRRAYASLDNVSQSVFYRQIMDLGVRDIILKANGTEADFRNMISNRTRRHEQIVTELISQGQSPSRAWVNASEISRREMAGEIVDIYGEDVGAQVEAQDVISRKEAARELGVASDAELDGHVIPMLIDTIKGLSKASDNRMAGSGNLTSLILFGFPITALKVMNRSLDYFPIGYARLKMSERETKKYANDPEYKTKYPSYKTDNQKQQRMAESMVGTLGLIALLAMVMGERDKEPEDRLFMVHNAGPRDRAARQIWRAAGNEPQSVQFRFGTNSPWLGISWAKAGLEVFAPIFAVAGATFDSTDPTIRREDAYDQVMVFASQSLASMSRPLSSIQDTAGVLSGKEMSLSSRSLANQIGFRASSFLPWSSLARNYNKWQGARDTTNALSAFSSMIPIVGPSLTEPALNSLGDPIGKTPNEYSYKLGTAIPVSVGIRREDTPLYEFLLNKGKFPTAISRPTQEKKYGKMSDETWRKYIEVRGQTLKSLILKRKDSLEKLDAERYDDAIENLTDIANDRARATLKMRPAPK